MTKEEKEQAKIRNAERKRMRRDERRNAKTRRPRDGTWTKKNHTTHFGNKLHTVQGQIFP